MRPLLPFLFLFTLANAQVKSVSHEKVHAELEKRRHALNEQLEKGDYKTIIRLAEEGLKFCPQDCTRAKAMFHLFAGVGHEFIKEYPEAENEFRNCLDYAIPLGKYSYMMTAMTRLQYIYGYTKQCSKRLEVIQKMVNVADSLQLIDMQLGATIAMSSYYEDLNEYENAIKYRLKSIEINKQLFKKYPEEESHKTNIGYQLNNVANLFSHIGQYGKALEYLREGDKYLKGKALKNGEETQYVFYIQAFLGLNQLDSANKYYHKTYQDMPADTLYQVLSNVEYLFGNYYLEANQLAKARPFAYRSNKYVQKVADLNIKDLVAGLMAKLYLKDGKYDLAVKEYRKVLQQDMRFSRENLASVRKGMAEAFSHLKLWDSAFYYLNAYTHLNDSIQFELTNKNFAEVEAKYQNEVRRQEINLLNEKNARAELRNSSLVAGSGLVILIAGMGFVLLMNRNKLKRLEENQRLRNKIAADLHDEVGSTLSSILLISEMAQRQEKDTEKSKVFTKILKDSRHIAESMDEIIWAVNPGNDTMSGIMNKLKEYAQQLSTTKDFVFHFSLPQDLENVVLPMDYRRNIYLIVKEALNNSIKYSEAKNIRVEFGKDMKIVISDDGKGFNTSANTNRNGLRNMKRRAEEINAELELSSTPGLGTDVILKVSSSEYIT
jgi:two-component system sensor histidine kinase UhpB